MQTITVVPSGLKTADSIRKPAFTLQQLHLVFHAFPSRVERVDGAFAQVKSLPGVAFLASMKITIKDLTLGVCMNITDVHSKFHGITNLTS